MKVILIGYVAGREALRLHFKNFEDAIEMEDELKELFDIELRLDMGGL